MSMPSLRYVVLEKPIGQTPLEAIARWKEAHPKYASLPATYAGRLDPMASGKLLVLLGDECKRRERYTGLDKGYVIEVALGLSTDTGDALGLAELRSDVPTGIKADAGRVRAALQSLTGSHRVPYPAFSSRTVNGKPLFKHALEGTLDTISIPEHTETIYRIDCVNERRMPAGELHKRIRETLRVVPRSDEPSKVLGADFRQNQIRAQWDSFFKTLPEGRTFTILTLRVTCASGTYMRTLAERLGKALGTRAFALSIRRTKIGRYVPIGPFGFWIKEYA